jgi:TrmH family RNA methyltransferase
MGSIFKSSFLQTSDIISFIKAQRNLGNKVYCTHLHSDSVTLGSFEFSNSDCIVIGNEGHGVSADVVSECDASVIIPMVENAESLNAATASSILIWEMNKNKLK